MTGNQAARPATPYVIPFGRVVTRFRLAGLDASEPLTRPLELVLQLVQHLLLAVPVDEAFYNLTYPDLAKAGLAPSAATTHFVDRGYFEGRLPADRDRTAMPRPYADIQKALAVELNPDGLTTRFTPDGLRSMLRGLIQAVPVDEDFYLGVYPDIAAGIEAGHFASGRAHYVAVGFFESRLPSWMGFDSQWYTDTYADVAAATAGQPDLTPADHFLRSGYREGRLPCANALRGL